MMELPNTKLPNTMLKLTVTSTIDATTNTSNFEDDDFVFDDMIQRVIVGTLFLLISIVGLAGNMLVMVSVLLSRRLRTTSNVFVVNLSVADFLACMILPMLAVQLFVPYGVQILPDWLCIFIAGTSTSFVGVSILTLSSISVTRALIVSRPLSLRYPRWLMVIWVASTWLVPLGVVFVPLLVWEESVLGYNYRYSNCTPKTSHPNILLYNGLYFMIGFPIPFLIIVTSFIIIFVKLRRHSRDLIAIDRKTKKSENRYAKEMSEHRSSSTAKIGTSVSKSKVSHSIKDDTTQRLHRRQVQITKNMMIIVCVFFACIAPYACGVVLPNTAPSLPYLSVFLYFNSCVNPLIYAKHPHFREIFSCILQGRWGDIPEKSSLLESITNSATLHP